MNNKGQVVFSEYVVIFFVVIAAVVAMTTFVQRGFEARIHDAKGFLINAANREADANFLSATGCSTIPEEYEPYYERYVASVVNNEKEFSGATPGNPKVIGVKYIRTVNGEATSASTAIQLPPGCAGPNPLPCCSTGCLPAQGGTGKDGK